MKSIVMKDIVERFEIKDLDLFNRIVEYIVLTPSQTFSAENLANYFSVNDVRGKRILNGKYYLIDLGIGQVLNTSKRPQIGAYLENIVYNELISREYDVKVCSLENGEVNFMAIKDKKKNTIKYVFLLEIMKI